MPDAAARPPAGQGFRRIDYVLVVSAAVFVGFLALAAAVAGGRDLWRSVAGLGGTVLIGALILSLVNYALRVVRWQVYTRALGLDVPLTDSALYYVAGFSMTATPGKVGEALRVWLLERCHGYRYARTMPLLVADRFSDVVGLGVLSVLGLVSLSGQGWIAVIAVVAIVAVLLPAMRPQIALALVSGTYRLVGRRPRLFGSVRAAIRDTARLFRPQLLITGALLSIAGWMAEGVALALVLKGLDADVGLLQAVVVFAAAMIVGSLTLLPGGLGGTEATMLVLLSSLDVPFDTAVAATAVIRVTTLWFAVVLGYLALPSALRRARRGETVESARKAAA